MAPTTAADRTLVSRSITRSLDWMLTRDNSRRRLRFTVAVESGVSKGWASSFEVVIVRKE
jgi:hypothetical protein